MLNPSSITLRLLPLLAAVASLGACAGHHGRPAESAASAPVRNTYVAERRYTKADLHETWNDGDAEIDVELALPAERGTFPLVLYLPGLGETAAGGATWRSTWAEAGYAVLSVQDKHFGATALASARARAGDFRSLAREDYAPAALARRIAAVEFAVAEVKRRAAASQAPWSSVDGGRLAVVGFDLGAQTASVMAGEAIPDLPPHTVLKPVAAILLSPYADIAAGGLAQRYAAMALPVLSVTGSEDRDSFGAVDVPALHRAPWQYMPAGDKYLLVLDGGTHALLGGSAAGDKKGPGEDSLATTNPRAAPSISRLWDADGNSGGNGGGGSRRRGKHPGQGGPGDEGGDTAYNHGMNMHFVGYVQGLSTAFLDAAVKHDPVAQEWLDRNATRWLNEVGEFRIR